MDEPGDPPCQRCRREKKECVFSETRRKRKTDDDGSGDQDLDEDHVSRNKRASLGIPDENGSYIIGQNDDEYGGGLGSGSSVGISIKTEKATKGSNRDVTNETAAALFQGPIIQPADALRMLVDAASRTENEERNRQDDGNNQNKEFQMRGRASRHNSTTQRHGVGTPTIDPAIVHLQAGEVSSNEAALESAIQAWSALRFVRAGWFTPREGIAYIQYFYEHLAPLTPISTPDFSSLDSHSKLLSEEPMLTVTMLTITSRYMRLSGAGGTTRSSRLHDRLWDYLQGMVSRMCWGQEQFGGGFCGAGVKPETLEARRRGLRSLGTVERYLA